MKFFRLIAGGFIVGVAAVLLEPTWFASALLKTLPVHEIVSDDPTVDTAIALRTKRVGRGFVLGEGTSVEEIVGAISSDMVLYGDLRDLVRETYRRVRGEESDNVVLALSGLGVVTEFVDAADWAPAILKACRKLGCLTDRFAKDLVLLCGNSVRSRKLAPELKDVYRGMKDLKEATDVPRMISMMKYVESADDLKVISRYARQAPIETSFVLKNEGLSGLRGLSVFGDDATKLLTLGARAGRPGLRVLKVIRLFYCGRLRFPVLAVLCLFFALLICGKIRS